jgi:hypothetical protein
MLMRRKRPEKFRTDCVVSPTAPCPIGHGWLMLHRMKFDARTESI